MIFKRNGAGLLAGVAVAALLSACVPENQYARLEQEYNQLNQTLSGQIAHDNVRITRMQGALRVAVDNQLLFPSGGWEMSNEAKQLIASIAPILVPIQQTQIQVTGYTDNTPIGPELRARGVETNQQLSVKRAQNVADFLLSQGVRPNLVSVQGFGDADPVAPNDTEAGRAKNRRVELVLVGSGG